MFTATEKTNIQPVLRVMPVLPVATIGQPTQDLAFREAQFIKGQDYFAHIIAKPDAKQNLYHVNVDGALLKMELGPSVQVGQTLLLKYMSASPSTGSWPALTTRCGRSAALLPMPRMSCVRH